MTSVSLVVWNIAPLSSSASRSSAAFVIKEIKRVAKNKSKSGGAHNDRYRVVNTTNAKTVEIRLCRGTLMWESFNTRIHLMYNIVNIARNLQGLVTLKKLIMYKNNWETIHMMNKYIEEQNTEKRRININEVSKTILLSSKDNLRPTSLVFGKSLAEE